MDTRDTLPNDAEASPCTRWVSISLFVAAAAVFASVVIALSIHTNRFDQSDEHIVSSLPQGIYTSTLHVPAVTDEIDVLSHCSFSVAGFLYKATTFQPKSAENGTKGVCLPSGVREDLCAPYGTIDRSVGLLKILPSCAQVNTNSSDFVGGCRVSDTQIIDYCITKQHNAAWDACLQPQTSCYTTTYQANVQQNQTTNSQIHLFLTGTVPINTSADITVVLGISPILEPNLSPPKIRVKVGFVNNWTVHDVNAPFTEQVLDYSGETVMDVNAHIDVARLFGGVNATETETSGSTVGVRRLILVYSGLQRFRKVRVLRIAASSCFPPPYIPPPCVDSPDRFLTNRFIRVKILPGPPPPWMQSWYAYSIVPQSTVRMASQSRLLVQFELTPCDRPSTELMNQVFLDTLFLSNVSLTSSTYSFSSVHVRSTIFEGVGGSGINGMRCDHVIVLGNGTVNMVFSGIEFITGKPVITLESRINCIFYSITVQELTQKCDGSFNLPPGSIFPCETKSVYHDVTWTINVTTTLQALQAHDNTGHILFNYKQLLVVPSDVVLPPNDSYACVYAADVFPTSLAVYVRLIGTSQHGWDLRTPLYTENFADIVLMIAASYKKNANFSATTRVTIVVSQFTCVARGNNDTLATILLSGMLQVQRPNLSATISEFTRAVYMERENETDSGTLRYTYDVQPKTVHGEVFLYGTVLLTPEQAPNRTVDFAEVVPFRCDDFSAVPRCVDWAVDMCPVPYSCPSNTPISYVLTVRNPLGGTIKPSFRANGQGNPVWVGVAPTEVLQDITFSTDIIRELNLPVALSVYSTGDSFGFASFWFTEQCNGPQQFQMVYEVNSTIMSFYLMGQRSDIFDYEISIELLDNQEAQLYDFPPASPFFAQGFWCKLDMSVLSTRSMITFGGMLNPSFYSCLFAFLAPGIDPTCCYTQTPDSCFS